MGLYEKTFTYRAVAHIPYRYVCGQCGREVRGKAEVLGTCEERRSGRNKAALDRFQLSAEEDRLCRYKAQIALEGRIASRRAQVAKGNFSLLSAKDSRCPYCSATQRWHYRSGAVVGFCAGGLGGLVCTAFMIVSYIDDLSREEGEALALIFAACAFALSLVAIYLGIRTWQGLRKTRGQALNRPEVDFERMVESD